MSVGDGSRPPEATGTVGQAEGRGGESQSGMCEQVWTRRSSKGLPTAHSPGRLCVGSPNRRGESSEEIHPVNTCPDRGQLRPQALGGCSGQKTNVHLKEKTHMGTVAFPRSPLPRATSCHGTWGPYLAVGPLLGLGAPAAQASAELEEAGPGPPSPTATSESASPPPAQTP